MDASERGSRTSSAGSLGGSREGSVSSKRKDLGGSDEGVVPEGEIQKISF